MKEVFKDIPDYEGLYQASNLGRVKSLIRKGRRKEGILKPVITKKGYHSIHLRKNNKCKTRRIHRLVLLTFVGKSNLQTNHIDCNKVNNKLENLEYCTCLENVKHAWENGLFKNEKVVDQFTIEGIFIRSFKSTRKAGRELNINHSHISGCCKSKVNIAGGFQWRYHKEKVKNIDVFINPCKKVVDQYDLNGNFIKSFDSMSAAGRELKINNAHIGQCCKGKRNKVSNFQWRYHKENAKNIDAFINSCKKK